MLFALDVLSENLQRGDRSPHRWDTWFRAAVAHDDRLDHGPESIDYLSEHDEVGIPIRETLHALRLGQLGQVLGQLLVISPGLIEERVPGQVIDEIE